MQTIEQVIKHIQDLKKRLTELEAKTQALEGKYNQHSHSLPEYFYKGEKIFPFSGRGRTGNP